MNKNTLNESNTDDGVVIEHINIDNEIMESGFREMQKDSE
jgi:hypothetical protein